MNKICRICGKLKNLDNFHKKKGAKDGCRNECKECCKDIQKKYKTASDYKEKRSEYDKNRYDDIKDKILERKKEYHKENQEKILKQKSEYRKTERYKIVYKEYRKENRDRYSKIQKKYRENNPHCVAWRSILYSTLKRLGTHKQGHTIDMLGYSAVQLKHHIENLFTTGMTWENHGEWHIDHIVPVSSFLANTPVSVVCALSNLQPLWATEREIGGVVYEGNLNKSRL